MGTRLLASTCPSIPSAFTQRASLERMVMCWGPRSLAGAAADALVGAPVAVLGEEPALLAQRRTLVAVDREVVRARERA